MPGWVDTATTVQLWLQMVGKTRLSLAPMVNHWWQVPFYVTSRGLGTSLIHHERGAVEFDFDFFAHRFEARTTDGDLRSIPLEAMTVAEFYGRYRELLETLSISAQLNTRPVEVKVSIPFEDDQQHQSYDPVWVERLARVLIGADRALEEFRAPFLGKVSPVHFFWGSSDLAVTRFSGARAPKHPGGAPNCPNWVMEEAYSHEVSSAGFWPGSADSPQAVFYSYAYPEPAGFKGAAVRPGGAYYLEAMGEFVLPYEAVRRSEDPEGDLRAFFDSTYEAAAELAGWDREALERREELPSEHHALH